MKILYVCHRFPFPPKRGGKIRPFNIIKHFTGAGHSVTVASLARSASEVEEGHDLRKYCAECYVERIGASQATLRMIARLPTATPSSMGYFFSQDLQRRIDRGEVIVPVGRIGERARSKQHARLADRLLQVSCSHALAAAHIRVNHLARPEVVVQRALIDRRRILAIVIRPIGVRAQMHRGPQSREGDVRAALHVQQHLA